MDLLNVTPENHDYDGLNESSSDIERLDVVFKILQKSSSPICLDYDHLFIPNDKKNVFNAKLISTDLVTVHETKMEPTFQLNPDGLLLLDEHGSYSSYIKSKNETYSRFSEEVLKQKELEDKIKKLTLESLEKQKANDKLELEIKQANLQLTKLQIKEAKNKRLIGFFAAIGGSILTLIITYLKYIILFLQQLLHQ